MIKYIKGDLLTTDASVIVHGCNCQGVMGSGVAKQIKEKYPVVYERYMMVYKKYPDLLGKIQIVNISENLKIVNCFTQEFYGKDGTRFIDYYAIQSCMRKLGHFCKVTNINKIAMPKIGCGLGGGNWNKVEDIIKHELRSTNVLVYEL